MQVRSGMRRRHRSVPTPQSILDCTARCTSTKCQRNLLWPDIGHPLVHNLYQLGTLPRFRFVVESVSMFYLQSLHIYMNTLTSILRSRHLKFEHLLDNHLHLVHKWRQHGMETRGHFERLSEKTLCRSRAHMLQYTDSMILHSRRLVDNCLHQANKSELVGTLILRHSALLSPSRPERRLLHSQ